MFVVGLFIGPFVGLALALLIIRTRAFNTWSAVAFVGLVALFLLFAAFIPLELRLGTVVGLLLGVLVSVTPIGPSTETSA